MEGGFQEDVHSGTNRRELMREFSLSGQERGEDVETFGRREEHVAIKLG